MPKSPLLPKTAQFQVPAKGKSGQVPKLLQINPPGSQPVSITPTQVDQELLAAQIKLNTDAMAEIEKLRSDRKELSVVFEQVMKEKEMLRAQLKKANEQMELLKKKMDKGTPNNGSNATDGPSQH